MRAAVFPWKSLGTYQQFWLSFVKINIKMQPSFLSPPLEHGWLLQTHIWKREHILDSPSESSPFHWWFIAWKERKVNQDCLDELSSIYLVIYLFKPGAFSKQWNAAVLTAAEAWSFFSGSGLYLASACLEVRRDATENLHPHKDPLCLSKREGRVHTAGLGAC